MENSVISSEAPDAHLAKNVLLLQNIVSSLKDMVITAVVELNLSDKQLNYVPNEITQLKQLRKLDISFNFIRDLPIELGKLQLFHLDASNNAFETVPCVLESCLPNLKSLNLSRNWIVEFNSPPACLTSIRSIDVSFNNLYRMPLWFLHSKCSLEQINMSHNPFSTQIAKTEPGRVNSSIRILKAECCAIKDSSFLESLISLEDVCLGNTQEKNLFHQKSQENRFKLEMSHFKSCTSISLVDSNLSFLPDSLVDWSKLVNLDISKNGLYALPDRINDLKALKSANLSNNCLQVLPENFVKLSYLETLHLCDNNMEELPKNLSLLKNLKILDLYNNKLQNIVDLPENVQAVDLELNYFNTDDLKLPEYRSKKDKLRSLLNSSSRKDGHKMLPPSTPSSCDINECPDSDDILGGSDLSDYEEPSEFADAPGCEEIADTTVANDWIIEEEEEDETDKFDPNVPVFHKPPRLPGPSPADYHPKRIGNWRESNLEYSYADIVVQGQFDDA